MDAGEVLAPLKGSSPVSLGAKDELDRLRDAMSDAALDATDFAGESASETLDHLTGRDEPVGEAARAYLDTIALRLAGGYDIADPCVIELPEMVLGTIWAAQDAVGSDASDDWVEAAGR